MTLFPYTTLFRSIKSKNLKSPKAKRKLRDFEYMAKHEGMFDDISSTAGSDVEAKVRELIFENFDQAEGFYVAYGREIGFDIRLQLKRVNSMRFVCNHEGYKRPGDEFFRRQEPRADFRCGCKTEMRVECVRPSCYMITAFKTQHNHELATGERAWFLRCNR